MSLALLLAASVALAVGTAETPDVGTVHLRAVFEPDLGIAPRVSLDLAGHGIDLGGDWVTLELPTGRHTPTLRTPGVGFSAPQHVDVEASHASYVTLSLRPIVRIEAPDRVHVAPDGSAQFRVTVLTDYPSTLPVTLTAQPADGVDHLAASALRGVTRADLRPTLELNLRVATDAATLALRLEPGGLEHRVGWQHATRTDAASEPEPAPPIADETAALDTHVHLDGPATPVLPGERVTLVAQLRNDAATATSYTLSWRLPEWLEAEETDRAGVLDAGASTTVTLDALVAFGPPTDARVEVTFGAGDTLQHASHPLRRALLELGWADAITSTVPGRDQVSLVRATNPLDRALEVTPLVALGGVLEPAATAEHPGRRWLLPPGDSLHAIAWRATGTGSGMIELALTGDAPGLLAHRLAREVHVGLDAATRRTDLRLPITLTHPARELVVWLTLPAGASVEPGTSRHDGRPLADPSHVAGGALWRLDPRDALRTQLSFTVAHDGPLPLQLDPALAVRSGATLLTLAGTLAPEIAALLPTLPHAAPPAGEGSLPAPRSDARGDAQPEQVGAALRILEPALGTQVRLEDPVRVVIEAPLGTVVTLHLNGLPVADSRLGLHAHDGASGRQRLEYYGLDLRAGSNTLTVRSDGETLERELYVAQRAVRLEIVPLQLRADGVTPILVEVRALDERGVSVGFGPLRIDATPAPLDPDAFPEIAGHHVLLRDGRATVRFAPSAGGGSVDLDVRLGDLTARARLALELEPRLLWTAQGSFGVTFAPDGVRLGADARGYLESSGPHGSLRVAVNADLTLTPDLGVRYRSAWDTYGSERFLLTGAADGAIPAPLRSDDGIAFHYQNDTLALRYESARLRVPGISLDAYGSALQFEATPSEAHRFALLAGMLPQERLTQRIEPDGTRRYALDALPRVGSERVTLHVTRDGREIETQVLQPGAAYVIDRTAGVLVLASALWQTDLDGNDLALQVTYTPEQAPRTALTLGAGYAYHEGPWTLEVGAARLPTSEGSGTTLGVVARYRDVGLEVAAGYERRLWEASGRAELEARWTTADLTVWGSAALGMEQRAALHARARFPEAGTEVGVDLRVARDQPIDLDAAARVALSDELVLRLRHRSATDANVSSALLEQRFGAITLGAGVRYAWDAGDAFALASTAWHDGDARVRVEHAQGVTSGAPSESSVEASVPIAASVLRVRLAHVWGLGSHGALGLQQRFGDHLEADLELRLLDDGAPVARATLSAPVAISDALRLELQAGVERPLTADGAFSAAVSVAAHYAHEALTLGAAADLALRALDPKLVLQADARWQPSPAHTLSAELSAQLLRDPSGRIGVAYAYHRHDLSLLTYHRARFAPELVLEGEIALDWLAAPGWSLRPAFAYRVLTADAEASVLQGGVGVMHRSTAGVQVGAVAYHAYQPALGQGGFAFGAEIGYELVPGAAVVLGYTIGDGPGLLAGGSPGVHVRVDVFGGTR